MRTPYDIIIKPIVSERSMEDAQAGKYTFIVAVDANKTEIKNAVEACFGVEVARVNVMNRKAKAKRLGVSEGMTSATKKAIVTLTADSKGIEFFQGL